MDFRHPPQRRTAQRSAVAQIRGCNEFREALNERFCLSRC